MELLNVYSRLNYNIATADITSCSLQNIVNMMKSSEEIENTHTYFIFIEGKKPPAHISAERKMFSFIFLSQTEMYSIELELLLLFLILSQFDLHIWRQLKVFSVI